MGVKIRNKFSKKEENIESVVDDDCINLFEITEASDSHFDKRFSKGFLMTRKFSTVKMKIEFELMKYSFY